MLPFDCETLVKVSSFRSLGERLPIKVWVDAQLGEEPVEVCDGVGQLLLFLLQSRNLLLQLSLRLGQGLHPTLQVADPSVGHLR